MNTPDVREISAEWLVGVSNGREKKMPRAKKEIPSSIEPETVKTKLQDAISCLKEINEERGIDLKGKKYTMVSDRVSVFRDNFDTDYSIVTDLLHPKGQSDFGPGTRIIMRAVIGQGINIIATGHAMEIVGDGFVNTASAVENAETSAIGRALASFGLAGSEFASHDEIEAHERKMGLLEDPLDPLLMDDEPKEPELIVDTFIESLLVVKSLGHLVEIFNLNKALIDDLKNKSPEDYDRLMDKFKELKQSFQEGETE